MSYRIFVQGKQSVRWQQVIRPTGRIGRMLGFFRNCPTKPSETPISSISWLPGLTVVERLQDPSAELGRYRGVQLGHAWTSCGIRATSLPSLPSSSFISFVSHGVSHGSPLRVKSFNGTKGFGFIICEARDLGLRKTMKKTTRQTLLNIAKPFWVYILALFRAI